MFDFHVHAGVLGERTPAEAIAYAKEVGYRGLALLARCDAASLSSLLPPLVQACREAALYSAGEGLAGVELVHVPPVLLGETVARARELGAQLVAVHGEFPGGAVPQGTTYSAIAAQVDILLHPGAITEEEARDAADQGVALELSLHAVHGLFNGHVAMRARAAGAVLVTGSNVRTVSALVSPAARRAIVCGAGLNGADADAVDAQCLALMSRCLRASR